MCALVGNFAYVPQVQAIKIWHVLLGSGMFTGISVEYTRRQVIKKMNNELAIIDRELMRIHCELDNKKDKIEIIDNMFPLVK